MGIVLSANGVGGAVAAQIITPIIFQEGNYFGYRNAYWLVVGILFVVGLLVIVLYKENPVSDAVLNVPVKEKKWVAGWSGIDIKEAKKRPYFYGALISMFFTGMILNVLNVVYATYFQDLGMEAGYVATVLSVASLALTGSKFLAGVMYDRFGLRVTVTMCDIAAVLSAFLLWCTTNSGGGMILAMGHWRSWERV